MDPGSRNSSKSENFFTDDSEDFFTKLNSSSIELSATSSDTDTSNQSSTTEESGSSSDTETVYYKHGDGHRHHKTSRKSSKTKKAHKSRDPRGNCIQVDLADLETSLNLLNKNLDTNPLHIPKSDPVYIAYENVKLFVSMFYGREEYPKILEIMNTFSKPAKIVPDTIGAFLFGCSQTTYGDISNKFCSPLCLQGILPNEAGQGSASFCPYQVWVLNETGFEPISDNSSDHAYIFVGNSNPQFTPKQITLLRSLGVKQAQVLRTQDARHISVIPLSEIDNLPVVQDLAAQKLVSNLKNPSVMIKQANNTASVNSSRLLAILLILILIGVAIWLIFKYVIPRR